MREGIAAMVAKKTAAHDSPAVSGEATPPDGAVAAEPADRTGAAPADEAPAKKAVAKKTAARKTAVKKTAAKKAGADGAAADGPVGQSSAAGTTAAEETAADTTAKKSTAKKAAPPKKAVPAKKTGAKTVVAKKTPGGAPAAAVEDTSEQTAAATALPKARTGPVTAAELPVRPGEDPWSEAEAEEARAMLKAEEDRLQSEIKSSEDAIAGLMRDSGDGAGDEADTGTKNITREHELALASNAREMLLQTERALERLDAGTYGLCENCGRPIGKARMQAFPRATLCVECKQKTERR